MSDQPPNFIRDYLTYTAGNEANPHYHLWGALSALSAIVSRHIWLDFSYFKIFPNLYVVLLGPPGNKKTTAMNAAKELVRNIGNVPFSAECQSKEALVKELVTQRREIKPDPTAPPVIITPMSMFVTELSQFIGIDPVRMIDFLVTIFDQNYYASNTIKRDAEVIEGPYLTLFGCTTPAWVTTYLKSDIITGGFSRRAVFCLETEDGAPIAFPHVSAEMQNAWNACITRGREIQRLYGEITWTPAAKTFWKHWYDNRPGHPDPTVAPFARTSFIQILKVAMLLTVARSDTLVMETDALETSIGIVDKVMVRLPEVFSGMGRNELAQVGVKILTYLRTASGPVPEKALRQYLWNDADSMKFQQTMQYLSSTNQIEVFIQSPSNRIMVALPGRVPAGVDQTVSAPAPTPPAATASGSSPSVDPPQTPT